MEDAQEGNFVAFQDCGYLYSLLAHCLLLVSFTDKTDAVSIRSFGGYFSFSLDRTISVIVLYLYFMVISLVSTSGLVLPVNLYG